MNKKLFYLALIFSSIAILFVGAFADTIFSKSTDSYYGRQSVISRITAVITPAAGDTNDVNSTAASDIPVFGELRQITIAAVGDDTDFTVIVKNSDLITLYEKTDCNTVLLPFISTLKMPDSNYPGILCAGPLIFETNDIDVNNLTELTISIDYIEQRY
ncbi:MAG: hypothetical protein WCZ89_06780 [Phycisphaerae bacterium]